MITNQKMVCYQNTFYNYVCTKCINTKFVTESDGSNDSGTSSFGYENKKPKSRLLNIPFIETIMVQSFFFF